MPKPTRLSMVATTVRNSLRDDCAAFKMNMLAQFRKSLHTKDGTNAFVWIGLHEKGPQTTEMDLRTLDYLPRNADLATPLLMSGDTHSIKHCRALNDHLIGVNFEPRPLPDSSHRQAMFNPSLQRTAPPPVEL